MIIPVELVVFLGGLIVAGLGSMGTAVVHLLIRIYSAVNEINTTMAVQTKRIEILEREKEMA